MNKLYLCAIVAVSGVVASANAEIINATITADNHYAFYSRTGSVTTFHGANESGAGGAPGSFNWSLPEVYSELEIGNDLYIAAWSDNNIAQGLLADVRIAGGETRHSGDARWQVFATGADLNDGAPPPSVTEIATYVAFADANSLWEVPFVGGSNGIAPWGNVPGISGDARWMWRNADVSDPLQPGGNYGEYLIFRMVAVPTPGATAMLGLGGLLVARRRR